MITNEMIDKGLFEEIDNMSEEERNRLLAWSDFNEFSFYYCYYLLDKIEKLEKLLKKED